MEEVRALEKEEQLLKENIEDRQSEISNLQNQLKILNKEQRVDTQNLNLLQIEIEGLKHPKIINKREEENTLKIVEEGDEDYNKYFDKLLKKAYEAYDEFGYIREIEIIGKKWDNRLKEELDELLRDSSEEYDEDEIEGFMNDYENALFEYRDDDDVLAEGVHQVMQNVDFEARRIENIINDDSESSKREMIVEIFESYLEWCVIRNAWIN